jgi:glucosylceramidase
MARRGIERHPARSARHEGQDSFIQEERYFEAYARYFARYVDAYAKEGITISTVMPQNEFNSAQPFPSCCWTPQGLARFIPHLARAVGPLGVTVFLARWSGECRSGLGRDGRSGAAAVVKGWACNGRARAHCP